MRKAVAMSGIEPVSSASATALHVYLLHPVFSLLWWGGALYVLTCSFSFAQQPQAQAGQAIYAVNAKYVNGVAPGYWPTAGAGLVLNISGGSIVCGNTPVQYHAGTLTMAASSTNYVQLNTASSCAPSSNTTGFVSGNSPIATVVTSGSAITTITDFRPLGVSLGAGGGSSNSLGNASTVIDISTVTGADFCAKAQTGNNALPAAGGVLDGRGLTGAQACAAPGLQLSPNVQLLFGATTLTEGAGVGIGLAAHDSIIGLGSDANNGTAMSVIAGNGTSPMVYQTDPSTDADNITITGMNIGNLSDVFADWPWNMAVYLPQATWLTFEQNHVYAAYGLYYGSHSAQRPDITSYTGCDCYSHIDHNLIQGFVEGLVLGDGANSNAIDHNEFGSFQNGGGIYVSVAAFTNHFSGVDCETINYCLDVYGQDTAIKDVYIEGAGLRGDAPAFANSTAYLAGQVITDGTNEEMVVVGGTSASSGTPSWPTTPDGAQTVSGTVTFQLVLNATIILQAQSNLTTFIGSVASTAGAPGMLTTMMPAFFTEQSHYYAQAPYVVWGQQLGLNGQTFSGGFVTAKTTLAAAPTLAYHLAGGTHTTTYYYYANLNTVNGATGLSPQANITSAPDALGVVETATVGNPGTGCTTGEHITLQVNTEGTEPVLTVAQTGGAATSFTIYNGGTVIPPGTYPIDTTTGHCSGTTAIVDSNYVVITPPQVTFNSVTSAWQFPGAKLSGWDIVGRGNATNYTIGDSNYGANLGPGSFCHSPVSGPAWSLIGSFCDYGSTHAAYTPPSGNSTGDAVIAGNVTVGAMSGSSGNCAEYGTGGILQAAAAACGSGTVTSVGLAGTSHQIVVTGSTPITSSGSWTLSIPAPFDIGAITWNNSGTCTFAAASVNNAAGTLTTVSGQSCTLSPTNLVKWGSYTLEIINASSSAATLTLGTGGSCSAWKVGGGGSGAITLSGSSDIDILAFTYDGTNCVANFRGNFN